MIKKIFIGIAALVLLIIASAIVLPIIFKDDIVALVKTEANKNINAELDFGDIGLSLFTNFPDFTLSIDDAKVTGVDRFAGVELADIERLSLSLDLMSVIGGEEIQINSVGLTSPDLHVIVLADGTANYDIAKASEETETEEQEVEEEAESSDGSFSIGLSEYFIRNANIIYDDRAGGMYAKLVNFTHEGSGDFTQDDFLLKTMTDADAITFKMDGISYLNRTALDMKFDMNMNMPNMRFEFVENYVKLNALHLGFDGTVAMPEAEGDPIDLDVTFETKETSFKSLLSMIPAVYMTDFEDIETSGNLALSGMAKGRMVGDQLPAFALDLTVGEAMFHYPDLPKSAENIAIDLHVKNPGGSDDNTVIDLNKFHVELANNPVDIVAHMRTPISDPFIDANVNMDLDLASLADVIPLEEGQAVTGKVFTDIHLKGNQSAIDGERYQDFEAGGMLAMSNIDYKDPSLPYETLVKACSLNFSPRYAELTTMDMQVGRSDMSLTGRIDNIVEWYVADADLKGTVNFSSSMMDLNEFMEESDEGTAESTDEGDASESEEGSEGGVAEVPAGFDFVLNTSITKMLYEDMEISNVSGRVVMRDQAINLSNLNMNMMDGSLNMTGNYSTKNIIEPSFDMTMDIIGWDIPMTYEFVDMVQKMAPIMENATGRFSTKMEIAGLMDQNMDPKYETLDGGGMLMTRGVSLNSPKVLERAAEATKYDGLKNLVLEDTEVEYYFEDGRIEVKPAEFVIGKEIPAVFSGSHGFDMTLDYLLNFDIPTKLMGGAATQVVSGLLSKVSGATGVNAQMPERVKVDLDITGTSEDPKVTPRIAGTEKGSVQNDLKDKAKEELGKKKEELENKARNEADKAKAKAQAEADKKKAEAEAAAKAKADEAKRKAEAEKKAAEEKAKNEAEAAKKKAEEQAKKKAAEEAKKKLKGFGK